MRRPAPLGTKPTRSAQAQANHEEREWWRAQVSRIIPHLRHPVTAAQIMRLIIHREPTPPERFAAYGAIDWLCAQHEIERVGNHDDGSYSGRWVYAIPGKRRKKREYAKSPAYRQAKRRGWRRGEIEFVDTDAEKGFLL